jgi:hypothetical protein
MLGFFQVLSVDVDLVMGHFPLISWGGFVSDINAYKANQRDLNIWVGDAHDTPQGKYRILSYSLLSRHSYLPI